VNEDAPEVGAAHKKPSRLRRVPTSLIVTLLGIALTAWLLPALTRQWDDRQKAQELKAGLVSDMARASARVIVGSRHPIIRGPSARNQVRLEQALDAWELAGVEIEEKLNAYFPATVAMEWRAYRLLLGGTLGSWNLQERLRSTNQEHFADREVSGDFEDGLSGSGAFLSVKLHKPLERLVQGSCEKGPVWNRRLVRTICYVDLERILLAAEHSVATDLLAAKPRGFSTTAVDFFRDLIP